MTAISSSDSGAGPSPAPAVRLQELSRRFGAVTAVDGLTFDISPGELFGLVGPDGAGKTTTLRMLAGVMRPTSGDALLDGMSVTTDPEAVKHSLAYMSQRFGLYTDLTVRENLMFYADLYHVRRAERAKRLQRLFAFSGLGPFQNRLAGALSGGMKQKLGLSCALVHEPRILLLDEPTFGVDPISRRDLWLIVHEMVARGVTVVVSTSYMDEAERFDRVALLHRGRLLALATPLALQTALDGHILEVRTDRVREAGERVPEVEGVTRAAVFGDRLHLVVENAERVAPAVERALTGAGFTVAEIAPITASMEDVFIERIAEADRSSPAAGGASP